MLEGKDLILATKPFTEEDRTKSWLLTLSTLLLLVLAHVGVFMEVPLAVKVLSSILAGLLIVRFFVIYHDYLHHAILRKSPLAKAIFTVFGLYILAPVNIWKRSHNYHHKHNSKLYGSSIGSFPIVTKQKFLSAPKSEQKLYLFIRHPLTIIFGYVFAFIYGMAVLSFVRNPAKHWDSALSLLLHFGIGTAVFLLAGWQGMILGFLLPCTIACGIGTYLFYAQHNFPGVTFEDRDGWTYINAALQSSSYMKMNPLMRWFTANIGYHHIHHINVRIPFYRLPEAYAHIPEFQKAKTTSLNPVEIWRCFRLKAWDPKAGKMVGMRELRA